MRLPLPDFIDTALLRQLLWRRLFVTLPLTLIALFVLSAYTQLSGVPNGAGATSSTHHQVTTVLQPDTAPNDTPDTPVTIPRPSVAYTPPAASVAPQPAPAAASDDAIKATPAPQTTPPPAATPSLAAATTAPACVAAPSDNEPCGYTPPSAGPCGCSPAYYDHPRPAMMCPLYACAVY